MRLLASEPGFEWRRLLKQANLPPVRVQQHIHPEILQAQPGREALGLGSGGTISVSLLQQLNADLAIEDRLMESMMGVLAACPFFLPHNRKVVHIAAMSAQEWHTKRASPWTVTNAFRNSPCIEEDLRECQIILYPHCESNHWTLYICFVELRVFHFFDPLHCSSEHLVQHRQSVFLSLKTFIASVARRDTSPQTQGTNAANVVSAAIHLQGIETWPLLDAHQIPQDMPRQLGGLSCGLHVIAYVMDVLSGAHQHFSDTQTLELRRWLKFVLATGTSSRIRADSAQ